MTNADYVTTGDIARLLGWPLHRVTNAIQRLAIAEDARAGTYRLFRRHRLPQILATMTRPRQAQPHENSPS